MHGADTFHQGPNGASDPLVSTTSWNEEPNIDSSDGALKRLLWLLAPLLTPMDPSRGQTVLERREGLIALVAVQLKQRARRTVIPSPCTRAFELGHSVDLGPAG